MRNISVQSKTAATILCSLFAAFGPSHAQTFSLRGDEDIAIFKPGSNFETSARIVPGNHALRLDPGTSAGKSLRAKAAKQPASTVRSVSARLDTSLPALQDILLGGAQDTAVLGGSTVTNTGPTVISGDVDVSPGTAITGFPPGTVVNGTIHSNDAAAIAAHAGALSAYNQLLGETATNNLTGINLGGVTLLPGIYHFDTFAQLSGILLLDTQGNPNAVFHFQIGTALLADAASSISLLNGNSVNIFWQVGTSATLGTGSNFAGTIIADQSITLNTGATLGGRALALNGAVTLDTNTITAPTPTPIPTPTPEPTATPLPTATPTATPGPTATPTATPGATATPSPTPLPTATPSATPGGTATPSPLPTASPTATPGPTATPAPTATPSVSPGGTATPAPPPTPTPGGTATPSPTGTPVPIGLIYPTDLTIIPTIHLVLTDIQIYNVVDRLADLHHSVINPTNEPAVIDSKDVMSDGKTTIDQKNDSPPRQSITSNKRWGFFITGTGQMVDVENSRTAQGSSFTTGGVTVGADYRLSANLTIGAALGYANTDADLNFGGSVRSNHGNASIYASYYNAGFFVDGVLTGGVGSVDTRRLTIGGVTYGDTGTADFGTLLGTGYNCRIGNLSIGPVASLRYARTHLDSFHEGDAFGSLYVNGHSQGSLRSAAGLQASYRGRIGRIPVTPMVRVQWQHEHLEDNASLNVSFDNQNAFDIDGPRLGRNSVRLDAGLTAQFTPAVAIFANYGNELGRENYNVQSVSGGLRVSF